MLVSNHPEDAAEIVRRASNGEGLLSNDGASIGNLVSGDAVRSYITMATIKDPDDRACARASAWYSFFVSPTTTSHTIVRSVGDVFKEYFQAAARDARRHRAVDASRHALPGRARRDERDAAIALDLADHGGDVPRHAGHLRRLHRLRRDRASLRTRAGRGARCPRRRGRGASHAPQGRRRHARPYKFVVLSDHGQSLGATFKQRYGETLRAGHRGADGRRHDVGPRPPSACRGVGPAQRVRCPKPVRAGGATGAATRAAFGGRMRDGAVELGPTAKARGRADREGIDQGRWRRPEPAAAGAGRLRLGNLALDLFPARCRAGSTSRRCRRRGRAWSRRWPTIRASAC